MNELLIRLPLLALLLSVTASCEAQGTGPAGPPARETVWTITQAGKTIGTERVRERLINDSQVITSKGSLQLRGAPKFAYEQKTEVSAKTGSLVRYELRSSMIKAEATLTDTGATLSRTYMGNSASATIPKGASPFVALDNLVWSQYTALGRMAVSKSHAPFTIMALVPQAQAGLEASFQPGESFTAKLDGDERLVRRGQLTVGGQLVALTYDAKTGRALRVEVPAQQFDVWIEGFKRPEEKDDDAGGYREEAVSVPAPLGALPGLLTRPDKGEGPFPVVVLLHGSGPNDRDETIGPNKPFRDLAHGLAREGIATLRYDKRTFLLKNQFFAGGQAAKTAAKTLETLGLEGESIDDGVAALEWLKSEKGFAKRFVLGHSLGAMAAPHVAKRHAVQGVILMAGPGRALDVLVREQMIYKHTLTGKSAEEAAQTVDAGIGKLFKQARAGELPGSARIMGATVTYWKSMFHYEDVPAAVAAIKHPVLLLQGDKDYQVTTVDYGLLKTALESRKGPVHEAHLFKDQNHLFMNCRGKSTGAEYMIKGHMEPKAISTVAAWIKKTADAQ